jgi:hypothetical protein
MPQSKPIGILLNWGSQKRRFVNLATYYDRGFPKSQVTSYDKKFLEKRILF